jgi:hypothetical protein
MRDGSRERRVATDSQRAQRKKEKHNADGAEVTQRARRVASADSVEMRMFRE